MSRRLVPVACALLLATTACGSISEGVITDKQFYDEYITLMPIYTYDSKGMVTGFYLEDIYTPPCWEFFLKNKDEAGSQCVEPRDYMVYKIGDYYRMPGGDT